MEIHDVVKKLVGPIDPVGASHIDPERLKNLESLCELVDRLLFDIADVAHSHKGAHEHSRNIAGEQADKFMRELKDVD
jgi:hypothetical protein